MEYNVRLASTVKDHVPDHCSFTALPSVPDSGSTNPNTVGHVFAVEYLLTIYSDTTNYIIQI